ncbi:molybdenum cofactor guanylyltransferase MobA [Erwiniaceae bacterium BAC15a-03b]|uniref:Molybdenum cofactor guanylyltransferase n=1 Tax=Winslowiella arboricola TaxID=2978220 RepID=A0A9J6PJG0_9GAMM|nr:molybdenum cofactor guanylyltransferase MobA [Winslowiella arboricola]MCU5773469.1 molybdenum cofactor guanylyltransferase MobA [Winslowiella arboricola]MCU5776619.1 molybdenum cofactor guanylyltransferase MobA [Winslowiella arboricola]
MSSIQRAEITGVILAGGRGSRMGGEDKGLMQLNGLPLYQHVLQRLQPQVASVCISANRNLASYQLSGLPVISDAFPGYAGPLAGMLAALRFINNDWALFAACDTPFIPHNLAERLWQQKGEADAVWARSDERDHPTLALIHCRVADRLTDFLTRGDRKLMLFLQEIAAKAVIFPDDRQSFININTPDDLRSYSGEC